MKHVRASRADRTDPVTGIVFDSASELRRWGELKLLEKAGAISALRRQVVFELWAFRKCAQRIPIKIRSPRYKKGRQCIWTADFTYIENVEFVAEEHKGVWTEAARLRVAIAEACYGFTVRITGPAKMRKAKRSPPRAHDA